MLNLLRTWDICSSEYGALAHTGGRKAKFGFLDSNLIRTFLLFIGAKIFCTVSHQIIDVYVMVPPTRSSVWYPDTHEDELSGYRYMPCEWHQIFKCPKKKASKSPFSSRPGQRIGLNSAISVCPQNHNLELQACGDSYWWCALYDWV